MSNVSYATYDELRSQLVSLQQEFDSPIHSLAHLYHDLIWAPEFESWSPEEFISFVAANKRGYRERWIRSPEGKSISRFTWQRNDDCVEEFLRLSERANRLLRSFEHLVNQYADTPEGFRIRMSERSVARTASQFRPSFLDQRSARQVGVVGRIE